MTAATASFAWDEPATASSPRGWLMHGAACVGFYLDYGPDNYRCGHQSDIGGGRTASFCQPDRLCRECQPGNVLAVRYPEGPDARKTSRYCETTAAAREFVERGD